MVNHSFTTFILIISLAENLSWASEPKLQLVNVVFRHGHRTPILDSLYPNDPYKNKSYFPEGFGVLTTKGKRKAYEFGQILRQKYKDFLSSTYMASNIYARSTDVNRTKLSLQFVLRGLYPKNSLEKWNESSISQPIPITVFSKLQDDLLPQVIKCKNWKNNYENVIETPEAVKKLTPFDNFIKNITVFTGRDKLDYFDLCELYAHLQSEQAMDLKLPNWTNPIFPSGKLLEGCITLLEVLNYDGVLKKHMGGSYLRKISETLLAIKEGSNMEKNRKMYLYGAHDLDILGIIAALNLKNTQIPNYCSAIIIELLLKDGIYYVKILHYLGEPSEIRELQIPNCSKLCPLDDFFRLTNDVTVFEEKWIC